jgi:hypothetical protein
MKAFVIACFCLTNALFVHSVFAEDELHPCPEKRTIQAEKGGDETFCKINGFMVTEKCFSKGKDCELLKDLKKAKIKSDMAMASVGNPGSKICRALKWKVLMGKMYDGSSVCTCQHPSGESIVCTSLF